jgi:hypothetical protein
VLDPEIVHDLRRLYEKWQVQPTCPRYLLLSEREYRKQRKIWLTDILEALEAAERVQGELQLERPENHLEFLRKAFSNLAMNCKRGKLRSLRLTVSMFYDDPHKKHPPVEGGDWNLVWHTAAHAFT